MLHKKPNERLAGFDSSKSMWSLQIIERSRWLKNGSTNFLIDFAKVQGYSRCG